MVEKKKNETIKVMLARMEEKQDNLATQFKTHMRHHWAASIALLTSGLAVIGACLVAVFKAILP